MFGGGVNREVYQVDIMVMACLSLCAELFGCGTCKLALCTS